MPRGLAREQFKFEMRAAWEAVDKNFDPELIFGKLLGRAVNQADNFLHTCFFSSTLPCMSTTP